MKCQIFNPTLIKHLILQFLPCYTIWIMPIFLKSTFLFQSYLPESTFKKEFCLNSKYHISKNKLQVRKKAWKIKLLLHFFKSRDYSQKMADYKIAHAAHTQCGNLRNFLLLKFCVKSTLTNKSFKNCQFNHSKNAIFMLYIC